MKKPMKYFAEITLPVTAPMEFEYMTLKYPLWARYDAEASEEMDALRKKLAVVSPLIKAGLVRAEK